MDLEAADVDGVRDPPEGRWELREIGPLAADRVEVKGQAA